MIKETLRPIRFNNGRGYYFAVSMQGVELLYPVAPQFENQNLLDLQDAKGNFVIRDEIAVVRQRRRGLRQGLLAQARRRGRAWSIPR